MKFTVDKDIRRASTIDAAIYSDPACFEEQKERLFLKTWQWVGDASLLPLPGMVYPFSLLPGFMDEPLLLVRNADDDILCLSNVCTHRGNLLVQHPGRKKNLVCGYHGRRFDLSGNFEHMPHFEEAENFPSPCDNLPRLEVRNWKGHLFTSLQPALDLSAVLAKMEEKTGWMPLQDFRFDAARSKDYLVHANWALYCENYLEGFHIPFVHPELNAALDFKNYTTELFDHGVLQTGLGKGGVECFDLPADSPDHGKSIAAYYYWIFPNIMFNFYPWGLSVNIVQPLSVAQTKVRFLTYIWNENKLKNSAGSVLDKVEREDEFIVETTQTGVQSRLYRNGRYSPKMETGTHHFHCMIAGYLDGG